MVAAILSAIYNRDKLVRIAFAILYFIGPCFSVDILGEVRTKFTYNGSPIHPGVIELFSNLMSDSSEPQIIAVDLSTAQKSNRFDNSSSIRDNGSWFRTKHSDPNDQSTFGYRFVGSLPSGTIVLHVYESGGGSGNYESALLLAVDEETAVAANGGQRVRQVLHVLRMVPIGDRANGEFAIDGSSIHIDRSKAHNKDQRETILLYDPQLRPDSNPVEKK